MNMIKYESFNDSRDIKSDKNDKVVLLKIKVLLFKVLNENVLISSTLYRFIFNETLYETINRK